jgi:hypothetical protein
MYNKGTPVATQTGTLYKGGFSMEKRFKVLRFVGSVYKILGIIIGAITILSALGFCLTSILGGSALASTLQGLNPNGGGQGLGVLGGVVGGVIVSLVTILLGGIYAVTIYALGEAVYLLIALEENTHLTAAMLHKEWFDHPQPLAPAPPQSTPT